MTLHRHLKANCPGVTMHDLEAVTGKHRNTLNIWWRDRREMVECLIMGIAFRKLSDSIEKIKGE